jgi:hypothetical protein
MVLSQDINTSSVDVVALEPPSSLRFTSSRGMQKGPEALKTGFALGNEHSPRRHMPNQTTVPETDLVARDVVDVHVKIRVIFSTISYLDIRTATSDNGVSPPQRSSLITGIRHVIRSAAWAWVGRCLGGTWGCIRPLIGLGLMSFCNLQLG